MPPTALEATRRTLIGGATAAMLAIGVPASDVKLKELAEEYRRVDGEITRAIRTGATESPRLDVWRPLVCKIAETRATSLSGLRTKAELVMQALNADPTTVDHPPPEQMFIRSLCSDIIAMV